MAGFLCYLYLLDSYGDYNLSLVINGRCLRRSSPMESRTLNALLAPWLSPTHLFDNRHQTWNFDLGMITLSSKYRVLLAVHCGRRHNLGESGQVHGCCRTMLHLGHCSKWSKMINYQLFPVTCLYPFGSAAAGLTSRTQDNSAWKINETIPFPYLFA